MDSANMGTKTQVLYGDGNTNATENKDYNTLNKIDNWSNVLSDQYCNSGSLFTLDGLQWKTVEHYYQASKFIGKDVSYYRSFSLDSGSLLSKMSGAIVKSAGQTFKLSSEELVDWDNRKDNVLLTARLAKFKQNSECASILVLTGSALLIKRSSPNSMTHDINLMRVRDLIKKSK
jgi:ribA/ribD-fused uncharacterized protein